MNETFQPRQDNFHLAPINEDGLHGFFEEIDENQQEEFSLLDFIEQMDENQLDRFLKIHAGVNFDLISQSSQPQEDPEYPNPLSEFYSTSPEGSPSLHRRSAGAVLFLSQEGNI